MKGRLVTLDVRRDVLCADVLGMQAVMHPPGLSRDGSETLS